MLRRKKVEYFTQRRGVSKKQSICRRWCFQSPKFVIMAKPTKKTPKEASNLFHNIMAASVKGNPKPVVKPIKLPKKKNNHLFLQYFVTYIYKS